MKTMTKIVTLPDGRQVTFTASYRSGLDSVRPAVTGPIRDLILLANQNAKQYAHTIKYLEKPEIYGLGFVGWLGYLFQEIGCRVEDHDDGGDWIIYIE